MLQIVSVALLILLPAFLMGMVMPLVLVWAGTNRERSVGAARWPQLRCEYDWRDCRRVWRRLRFDSQTQHALHDPVRGRPVHCRWPDLAYQPKVKREIAILRRAITAGVTLALIVLMFLVAPRINLDDLSWALTTVWFGCWRKRAAGVDDGNGRNNAGQRLHELLMYEEGPTSTVSVRKDWDVTSMAINGRTNASDREDMATQVMLGQMPLLLAPRLGMRWWSATRPE